MSDELVLDTPVVRGFLDDVRAAIAQAGSPEEACEAIRPRFAALLADDAWLPDEYMAPVPGSGMGGGIGQWLLYRAGDGSLSLFSLVVPPGSATPVHDHLAWGLVGLYRGTQDEEVYAETGDGLDLVESRELRPGDFYVAHPAARRHPPRAHDLRGAVGLDPPAHERHGLRLAALVRPGVRRAQAVPVRLGQRALRRRRGLKPHLETGLFTAAFGDSAARRHRPLGGRGGFDALEVHCPPGAPLDFEPPQLEISALSYYPNNLDPDAAPARPRTRSCGR